MFADLHAFEFNQKHLEKEHSNCTSRRTAIGTNMGALEEQLGTIIDKSSKDLLNISTEYYSQKQQWEKLRKPPPRVSRYPSLIPSSSDNERFIFDHIVNEIENSSPCGPYQQAAVNAFHATRNGSRHHATGGRAADDIRAAESRMKQDVDRLVNDKFKCTSIAIDALRDQLVILADELRELNRNATLQERRVNVLCHDVDSRRGIINTMEAHMLDENGRIKTIGLEIERLKEVIATKASFVDVKTELKSNRLKSKTSLSDLKAQLKRESSSVMNEVNDLKKWMQQQYSEGLDKQMNQISSSTQAFQRNLVEIMKRMVHEEVASTEQKCLAVIEREMQKISAENNSGKSKEYVKIISQIVTKAATKIESNLREDLEKKLEKMINVKQTAVHQQDIETIDNRIKETVFTDLNSMKESMTQLSIKQEQFISKDGAELLTESCRTQLSQSMSRLEAKCATAASNASLMATSMSESIMQKWKIDHENILNRLQHFITKDEANDIAGVTSKIHFDKCLSLFKEMETKSQQHSRDLISKCLRDETAAVSKRVFDEQFEQRDKAAARTVETQIDASKAQLMDTISAQLRHYTTKEEASGIAEVRSKIESDRCFQITADRCHSTAGKLVDMEAKLEEIESDFDNDVYKLLIFVKSIDDRVSTLETMKNEQISQAEENAINGALLSDINREKVSMGSIVDQSNILKFKRDSKVMQTTHRSKVDTLSMSTKDCIPVQAVNTGSPVSVNDGTSGSNNASDSLSQRSCESDGSSHAASENDKREVGEQQTLIQERNRMLSNVARTLSAVAARRDDSSLRQLAAELRAGKLDINTSKTHDQEAHGPIDPNDGGILGIVTAQQSDGESIDTARAMSLCCVQLDESYDGMGSDGTEFNDNIHRSESPVSFVGTIDTAEAISLCRLKSPSNQHDGLELKDEFIPPSTEKNSHTSIEISIINCTSSSHGLSDESGSHSLKLLDHSSTLEEFQFGSPPEKLNNNVPSQTLSAGPPSSITSDQSEHAVELFDVHYVDSASGRKQNNSVVEKEQMTILASENTALEHQSSSELLDVSDSHTADPTGGRPCDSSLIVRYEEDVPQETREAHVSSCVPTELQTLVNENVKVPSLPSIDIVLPPVSQSHSTCSYIEDEESLPGSLTSADEIFDCNPSSHRYNPTRVFNPEPYRGWDALLTELKASGRTLRDGNSSDESSHGSISFDSENAE